MNQPHEAPGQRPGASSFPAYDGPPAAIAPIGDATAWAAAVESGLPVLVVDEHSATADAARAVRAVLDGCDLAVGGAPVADTVKAIEDGVIVATIDRETLTALRPPLAVSPRLAAVVEAPVVGGLVGWVERCRGLGDVEILDVEG